MRRDDQASWNAYEEGIDWKSWISASERREWVGGMLLYIWYVNDPSQLGEF